MKKQLPLPLPGRGQLRYFRKHHPLGEMITDAAVQRNSRALGYLRPVTKFSGLSRPQLLSAIRAIAIKTHLFISA